MRLRADVRAFAAGPSRATPPARLGDFALHELIGRGAMGDVYAATDLVRERSCALKVVSALTGVQEERFRREATLASRLNHEGIARVYASGQANGFAFIASEFVDGVPLSKIVEHAGDVDAELPGDAWFDRCFDAIAVGHRGHRAPLPSSVALHIGRQIARALAHAHAREVVHRDIKPANVMVSDHGVVTLVDFGIARDLARWSPRLTAHGIFVGTTDYAAPEQLAGSHDAIGPWTDVFSWGVTMFELLTRQLPWPPMDHARETATRVTDSLKELNPLVPLRLDAIVMRALALPPEQRFRDAGHLSQALNRGASRRITASQRQLPPTMHKVASVAAGIAITGGVILGLLLVLFLAMFVASN